MNTIRRLKTENPDNKTARFGNPWKINAAPTQIRGGKKAENPERKQRDNDNPWRINAFRDQIRGKKQKPDPKTGGEQEGMRRSIKTAE